MLLIKISTRSKKKDVIEFLEKLNLIINDEKFDIYNDITLINKRKLEEKSMFSTPYTLLDLEYDTIDIVERLRELTIQEYTETLFDKDDDNPPLLFVFGKVINCKTVYIKLKIKDVKKKVLCLSFHYAEYIMNYPYINS